ncbi:unnamed protein product [Acanthoscelides obtectus]|uniref:Uncharacterized protein n=1 Tax=Acanthoscelides obtectus TaxID=200917 RepID=A0A9P0NZG1_ACAOB|nr:unnamed protein product [Acanthoscelides obtectus]CAK1631478.1 DNA repair protein complementing XP-C cells homolog [Acanthoscelides obtectus]
MRRAKAGRKVYVEDSSDSEDEQPTKKIKEKNQKVAPDPEKNESSSSESDIENYLQRPDKIDLSSEFYQVKTKDNESEKFEETNTSIRRRLSSSDSDENFKEVKKICIEQPHDQSEPIKTKLNFKQIQDYSKKMDEAKRSIETYNAKKKKSDSDANISDLLAIGESKTITEDNISANDLHSSDFESSEDEWEEVKGKTNQEDEEKIAIPKHAVEITVDTVPQLQKKKRADVLAAMKRRLNRIRKENQVLVHKVHLLCWIAHGNFINSVINNTEIMGLALSLMPSEKCYPADRVDLSYLEQIVQWFKKSVQLIEMDEKILKDMNVLKALQIQLQTKKAYNKKYLVYMFVAMMRALGIQCRLVFSFQLESLRPPASELHSLKSPAKASSDSKNKASTSKKVDNKRLSVSIVNTGTSTKGAKSAKQTATKNLHKKNEANVGFSKSETDKKVCTKTLDGNPRKTENSSKKGRNTKRTNYKETDNFKATSAGSLGVTNLNIKDNLKVVGEGRRSKSASSQKQLKPNTNTQKSSSKSNNSKKLVEVTIDNGDKKLKVEGKSRSKSTNDSENVDKKAESTKTASKKGLGTVKNKANKNTIKVKLTKDKNPNLNVLQLDGVVDDSCMEWLGHDSKNLNRSTIYRTTRHNNCKYNNDDWNLNFVPLSVSTSQFDSEENTFLSNIDMSPESFSFHYTFKSMERVIPEDRMKTDNEYSIPQLDGNDDKSPPKKMTRSRVNIQKLKDTQVPVKQPLKKPSSTSDYNSEDDFSPSPTRRHHTFQGTRPQLDVKNDIMNLIKGRIAEQKHIDRSRMGNKRKPRENSDSDSDYVPAPVKKKHHDSDSDLDYFVPKPKVKKRIKVKRDESGKMKVLSSSSEDLDESGKKKNRGINVWAEIFLEMEEKWITADVVKGQVHCVDEIYKRATHPVTYIVAWNNDNTLKDITMRYCKNFSTVTRKLRVDSKWWEETIQPFKGKQTVKDKEEDDDLNRQQLDQPLPKSIAEYKNHPLYALKRHLLKFEAMYPPDVAPLGFIRGEAVYPRNCVYVCRSRDIWLKEAKVVKPGEKPYKIVKARPKWDKLSNSVITDQMLEIFGIWQTMDYEPPTAENGIVPRNAFGNVELFKPCMLPKKTVHLRLPGLNRICKRMNIDCAAAIVGFDFHCGGSVPSYDGFVICEEYADQLIAAWELVSSIAMS